MTTAVPATEFCRNFATYQRQVQREPIQVQSHGKTTGYFVSAEEFERVQRILSESRKAYHPAELPPHLRTAVAKARMSPKHAKLNRLLKE
jgi:PHD/YefM family antitoxin component YafN of YafNO toxin-antitoxin module